MEKDRGAKILGLLAIFIAVVGTTIGFATFSTTLNIEGSATVKKSNWEVVFDSLSAASLTGTASEVTHPTIQRDSTLISAYDVELKTPGDEISYTFDILNNGTYNAKITGITIAGLGSKVLTATGGDATDQQNVLDKLTYTLTYADSGQPLAVNDTLPAMSGSTPGKVTAKLTLKYASFDDETLLPKDNITIGGLDVAIIYGQAS